jgi:hypothetical protein
VSIPVAEKARARKIEVQRADAPMQVGSRTIEHEEGREENRAENKAVEA